MPVLSHGEIADLWVKAGGNPQTADAAASAAVKKSGGRTDAPGGLWGLDGAAAGLDPMNDARAAVNRSSNGLDFGWVQDWLSENTGIADLGRFAYYITLVPVGILFISTGLILMFFGSRPVKAAFRLVGEQAVGGLGFGIGAAAVTPRGRRPPPFPPPADPGTVAPTPPPAPASRPQFPPIESGPPVKRSFRPVRIGAGESRDRRVISGEWTWGGPRGDWTPPRRKGLSVLFGEEATSGYAGRHRSG